MIDGEADERFQTPESCDASDGYVRPECSKTPVLAMATQLQSAGVDPHAVIRNSLERMSLYDARLNITVATFEDAAYDQLGAGELRGLPLAGQPVAVKDTFALPWWAPRDGTGIAYSSPGAGSSDLYRRVRAAGGVVLYATNMHQIGFGTTGHVSHDGPCRNPWEPTRCAGGSSGGSAAAVAVGSVGLAVGTDAAGSVRIPASYCGVVGLKPTWGSIGHAGASSPSSLMSVGLLTRSAADARVGAQSILRRPLPAQRRQLRIAILRPFWSDVDPSIRESCLAALAKMADAGCSLIELDLDVAPAIIARTAGTALALERRERLTHHWRQAVLPHLHPRIRESLRSAETLSTEDAALVAKERIRLVRVLDQALVQVDVLAWPTAPSSPPFVERPRALLPSGPASSDLAVMGSAAFANITGVPAVSIPCGLDSNGMPVGLSLLARWSDEATLLDAAELLEDATDQVHIRRPPDHSNLQEKEDS